MSPALRYMVFFVLLSMVPIAWHFGTIFGLWGEAPQTRGEFFVRIGVIIIVSIIASIISAILMAAAYKTDKFEPDEREKLILQKAELTGYYVLASGIVITMWFVFKPLTPVQICNALLAAFALSELSKVIAGMFLLRRI